MISLHMKSHEKPQTKNCREVCQRTDSVKTVKSQNFSNLITRKSMKKNFNTARNVSKLRKNSSNRVVKNKKKSLHNNNDQMKGDSKKKAASLLNLVLSESTAVTKAPVQEEHKNTRAFTPRRASALRFLSTLSSHQSKKNIDGLLSSCLSNKSKIVQDKENKMVENNKKVIKKKKAVNGKKRKFDTSERTWYKSVQSTDSGCGIICPVCLKNRVHIKRHLMLVHKWCLETSKKFMHYIEKKTGKKIDISNRYRKLKKCPFPTCNFSARRLEHHLRSFHGITSNLRNIKENTSIVSLCKSNNQILEKENNCSIELAVADLTEENTLLILTIDELQNQTLIETSCAMDRKADITCQSSFLVKESNYESPSSSRQIKLNHLSLLEAKVENVPENNGFDDLSDCESSISSFTGFPDSLLDGESTNLSTFADFNDDLSDVESVSSTNSSFDGFDDICVKTECTTNELTVECDNSSSMEQTEGSTETPKAMVINTPASVGETVGSSESPKDKVINTAASIEETVGSTGTPKEKAINSNLSALKSRCPVCSKNLVELVRHMRNVHKLTLTKIQTILNCNLQKKTRIAHCRRSKYTRKSEKCPVPSCGSRVKRLACHLKAVHKISNYSSDSKSNSHKKNSSFCFRKNYESERLSVNSQKIIVKFEKYLTNSVQETDRKMNELYCRCLETLLVKANNNISLIFNVVRMKQLIKSFRDELNFGLGFLLKHVGAVREFVKFIQSQRDCDKELSDIIKKAPNNRSLTLLTFKYDGVFKFFQKDFDRAGPALQEKNRTANLAHELYQFEESRIVRNCREILSNFSESCWSDLDESAFQTLRVYLIAQIAVDNETSLALISSMTAQNYNSMNIQEDDVAVISLTYDNQEFKLMFSKAVQKFAHTYYSKIRTLYCRSTHPKDPFFVSEKNEPLDVKTLGLEISQFFRQLGFKEEMATWKLFQDYCPLKPEDRKPSLETNNNATSSSSFLDDSKMLEIPPPEHLATSLTISEHNSSSSVLNMESLPKSQKSVIAHDQLNSHAVIDPSSVQVACKVTLSQENSLKDPSVESAGTCTTIANCSLQGGSLEKTQLREGISKSDFTARKIKVKSAERSVGQAAKDPSNSNLTFSADGIKTCSVKLARLFPLMDNSVSDNQYHHTKSETAAENSQTNAKPEINEILIQNTNSTFENDQISAESLLESKTPVLNKRKNDSVLEKNSRAAKKKRISLRANGPPSADENISKASSFSCPECEYNTLETNELVEHIRSEHTLERPLKCSLCDYSTNCQAVLDQHAQERHQNTLSKQKNLCCPECKQTFSNLLRHMTRVHKWNVARAAKLCYTQALSNKKNKKNLLPCPIESCGAKVRYFYQHLRRFHKMSPTDPLYALYSRMPCSAHSDKGERSAKTPRAAVSGKEIPRTADSGKEIPRTADSGKEISRTADSGKEIPRTADSDKEIPRTAHSDKEIPRTAHSGKEIPRTAHSGKEIPRTAHSGKEIPRTAHSDKEIPRTAHSGKEIPRTAHSGKEIPRTAHSDKEIPRTAHSDKEIPGKECGSQSHLLPPSMESLLDKFFQWIISQTKRSPDAMSSSVKNIREFLNVSGRTFASIFDYNVINSYVSKMSEKTQANSVKAYIKDIKAFLQFYLYFIKSVPGVSHATDLPSSAFVRKLILKVEHLLESFSKTNRNTSGEEKELQFSELLKPENVALFSSSSATNKAKAILRVVKNRPEFNLSEDGFSNVRTYIMWELLSQNNVGVDVLINMSVGDYNKRSLDGDVEIITVNLQKKPKTNVLVEEKLSKLLNVYYKMLRAKFASSHFLADPFFISARGEKLRADQLVKLMNQFLSSSKK